ncbi:hypothetical protein CVU82_04390 [Candidatus Falkowbacteria bacterium HGW-Falkowbacteria-1]|jgi:putative inorganic carbon (HCO3(-)) transporter|uniref:O-antigen ligase-related domain-containing protein n=1 Tax=Candidatus Falkowbacteria bacterium HGW-Falkowbacteria-1 TaxID=2013768 RepID=A0A2N2E8G2_9BACT|nr:MAG: hypothetical protein CVU82_04390 [Candidatus Falkowbacteria bacterium HGW-Falkowbacteria-1]
MSKSKFFNFIDFFVESVFLAIIFLLPLYFCFYLETNEVFEFHKEFIFRTLFSIASFLVVLKFVLFYDLRKNIKIIFILFKKYFLPFFLLLFFAFLSLLWSFDKNIAFFGLADRQFGFLSWLLYLLFFVLLILNLVFSKESHKKILRIINTMVLSSFLVSIYAVCQFFGLDFFIWAEPASLTGRAFSTLGQPNFLGSFLLLTIPGTFYLFKKNKNIYLRGFYLLSLCAEFLAIIFSGSRGAWLSFLLTFFIFISIFYFKKEKKKFFLGLSLIFIIFLLLFFGKNSFSNRFKDSFNLSSGSSAARTQIWSASLQSIYERPVGYGLENQKNATISFYQKDWGRLNMVNVVFDRSHNVFLDVTLELGVFGLLIFLYLLYFIFKICKENLFGHRLKMDEEKRLLSLFISFSLLSYFFSLQFNFSSVATIVYLLVLLAVVLFLNFQGKFLDGDKVDFNFSASNYYLKTFLVLIFLFISSLGLFFETKSLRNDYYLFQAKNYFGQARFSEGILMFSYVSKSDYRYDSYSYYFVDTIFGNYFRGYFSEKSLDYLANIEINKILDRLEKKMFAKSSFENDLAIAQIYSILNKEKEAENIFLNLINQSPQYPDFRLNLARHKIVFNKYDEALDILNNIYTVLPEGYIESDISRNRLSYYRNFIDYEIRTTRSLRGN